MSGVRRDLRRMLSLLKEERDALLRADFNRLELLGARKASLVARLEQGAADGGNCVALVECMQHASARNARLYEAALRGVREAHALLDVTRRPPPGRVYGRNGCRKVLETPIQTLERRA